MKAKIFCLFLFCVCCQLNIHAQKNYNVIRNNQNQLLTYEELEELWEPAFSALIQKIDKNNPVDLNEDIILNFVKKRKNFLSINLSSRSLDKGTLSKEGINHIEELLESSLLGEIRNGLFSLDQFNMTNKEWIRFYKRKNLQIQLLLKDKQGTPITFVTVITSHL